MRLTKLLIFTFAIFFPAVLTLAACQSTTPTNCRAYLANETVEQVRALADAVVNGSKPLLYGDQIVGAIDTSGKIIGSDPRQR